ncbi:MAG: hypothetical protein ACRD29_05540 [Acidimicrobiales bacterium]
MIAALPRDDVTRVGREVLLAVRALRDAGEEARGAEFARVGVAALGDDIDVPVDLRAQLAIELGTLLEALGDKIGSVEVFERATVRAREADVPELEAMAELGAVRFANPFMPQLDRLRRLAAIDEACRKTTAPCGSTCSAAPIHALAEDPPISGGCTRDASRAASGAPKRTCRKTPGAPRR